MHLCTAHIALGGDQGNVVVRGPDNPVSWPEVGLLQFLHGEENVFNVEAIREEKTSSAREKDRLAAIYGQQAVDFVYPGRSPAMEMEMPNTTIGGAKKANTREPKRAVTNIPPLEDSED